MDDHQCIKYAFSLFYFIFIDVPIIYFFGRKLTNFFSQIENLRIIIYWKNKKF